MPNMQKQGSGRIIGVTTSMSTMYRECGTPYGPSKAAHEAMIAMASRELEGTGVTANVLVPGGRSNTDLIPDSPAISLEDMIHSVMAESNRLLASEDSGGINGRRFIAYNWDESLPLKERLDKAGAPAAWPQLGGQAIRATPQ